MLRHPSRPRIRYRCRFPLRCSRRAQPIQTTTPLELKMSCSCRAPLSGIGAGGVGQRREAYCSNARPIPFVTREEVSTFANLPFIYAVNRIPSLRIVVRFSGSVRRLTSYIILCLASDSGTSEATVPRVVESGAAQAVENEKVEPECVSYGRFDTRGRWSRSARRT